MTTRGVKYDLQLDPISAPVKSAEGDLLMAAGKSEGQANAIKGQTDAATLSFLGTTAIGAAKGKMESDLDASIKNTLSRLDVTREAEFQRTTQAQATQIATLLEQSDGLDSAPELIKQFKNDTQRYTDALAQGVLTRQEVIDRIAADVKKYSATMPGWASDFRKLAAERTGISNIDVYGIHKALTEKTARERAAEERFKADMELDKEIAKKHGVGLDGITPEMRAWHYNEQQTARNAAVLTDRLKVNQMVQEQADGAWGQLAMLRVNEVVAGLAGDIATLGALNQDPKSVVQSQEFGLKLSGKLAATAVMLESQIRGFTTPAPGRTAMSEKEASRLIGEVRATFKNYEDMVKNVEGRNMFANIVKNSKGNMELLMNNFMLANPHTAVLKDIGVLPKLFEAKVALDDAEFERRFPGLLAPMKAIMTGPGQQAYAGLVSAAGTGKPVDLDTARSLNSQATKVATAEWVEQMRTIPKMDNPDQKQIATWVNITAQVGKNFGAPRDNTPYAISNSDFVAINQTFADPAFRKFVSTLQPAEAYKALDPFLQNVEWGTTNISAQLRALVAQYNDPKQNPIAETGQALQIVRNATTGLFEAVVEVPKNVPEVLPFKGRATPTMTFDLKRRTSQMRESMEAADAVKRAKRLAEDLNKLTTTYSLVNSMLNQKEPNLSNVQELVYKEYLLPKPQVTGNATPKKEPAPTTTPAPAPEPSDGNIPWWRK